MSKLQQKLPVILIILEAAKGFIQPIAQAITSSGGLGFRKRVREFADETRKSVTELSEAVKMNAETTAEDIEDIKQKLSEHDRILEKLNKNG